DADLVSDEGFGDWPDGFDAQCVLSGQGGDGGHGEAVEGGDGLDIGLDAGTSPRIGSGDDEDTAFHPETASARAVSAMTAHRESTMAATSAASSPSAMTR